MKPAFAALPNTADPHLMAEPAGGAATPRGWPIDLIHLTRQTIGDKRLETELLRLFLRQSEQMQKSLCGGAEDGAPAMPDVELLHILSGSARVIGARDVATLAGALETRLRSGVIPALDDADRDVLSEVIGRTSRYIAELLDQG